MLILMMQHLRLQTAIHMRRGIYGIVEYLCSGQVIWLISQERNVRNCIQPAVTAKRKVPAIRRAIRFSENVMKDIVTGSIETLVLEHCDNLKVVEADILWKDIDNVCDIEMHHSDDKPDNIIKNDCSNISVINNAQRQLVVANDLRV